MASSAGVVRGRSAIHRCSALYSRSLIRVKTRHPVTTSLCSDPEDHRHNSSTTRTVASAGLVKEAQQLACLSISISETIDVPVDKSAYLWYTCSLGP
jgi:hypothetical protein